jgi:hypothetical protein
MLAGYVYASNDGMNINALVRIPTNAIALLNRLFRTITHETVRRVTAPRI